MAGCSLGVATKGLIGVPSPGLLLPVLPLLPRRLNINIWIKGRIQGCGFLRIFTVSFLVFLDPAGSSRGVFFYIFSHSRSNIILKQTFVPDSTPQ